MANWKALSWSEEVTTGKAQARSVFTQLCLKCDDHGVVYSDAERIAKLCELSRRRLLDWRDYLAEHDFVTVIRRMRPNGREAKPLTLVNYPSAPHLNGRPVTLDYNGHVMYPCEPDRLAERGIQWVADSVIGTRHPTHTTSQPGDELSPGPGDNLTPGMTSEETKRFQFGPGDSSSLGPGDSSSPPGGDSSSPLNQYPRDAIPNQLAPNSNDDSGSVPETGGWLDESTESNDTVGSALLRNLTLPQGAAALSPRAVARHAHVVNQAYASGYTPVALVERLTTGLTDTRNPAGVVVSRLGDLASELEQQPTGQDSTPGVPAWCGECGQHFPDRRAEKNPRFRVRVADDGSEYRCQCHPRYEHQAAPQFA